MPEMIPGRMLHRLAGRICSAKHLERVVEPAIADLQCEYVAAESGSVLCRARILVDGYLAILEVMLMCALQPSAVPGNERWALVRMLAWTAGITACASGVLILMTVAVFPGISRPANIRSSFCLIRFNRRIA
jgi:hypothetical protein